MWRNEKAEPAHPENSDNNNNDSTLNELASSLTKDTGITGCSSPQVTI